ncbi:5-oxoprolinase subunit PxpB [Microvirga thermotolerans]|uniref:5-oxoprolinase subunit PxpB n=1 Tax=Microvirga thermotolerans TaxID=2651334 RepID=A0A5P9K0P1_9HYPH|nr:5-oxoprolinase subunit PxpB [Microvirga thermotolerans]QFU17476.1 5-oxoprolinase subunit PxpB [Microvirga thermotolerans]
MKAFCSGTPVQAPRILPCGDSALSVEFGDTIDPEVNGRVLALDEALRRKPLPGILETVPTYRSLLVHFDPVAADFAELSQHLLSEAEGLAPQATSGRRWKVPVVYGGPNGIDLEEVAERHGMSPARLIELHSGAVYRIYMLGFMPGFAYLGGLDPRLATPRRVHPRARIPSGSIIIGGAQAAVASIECPSGWHLLGRTPVRSYDPGREPVFLFSAGDEIVFEPVGPSRWDALERAAEAGEPVAEQVTP